MHPTCTKGIIGSDSKEVDMAANDIHRLGLSPEMLEYRNWLVAADQKASEAYDKAVMTLAGGALGLSLTFVKEIARSPRPESLWRLETSWLCLTLSLGFILVSMLWSQWALRKAMRQVDEFSLPGARAGGGFAIFTAALNVLSSLALLVGIGFLAWFSISNVKS